MRKAPCLNCRTLSTWADAPPFLCPACDAKRSVRAAYAEELTPIGIQLVIPGTERQPVAGDLVQLNLFGG